ncbi:hypothetical protein CPY53_20775 [Paenibacillus polymyxa]|nr:hypothetical protein C400_06900 [Paenibacillus sp. ICGEB2008]UNL95827.1 hypothetical protein CPY53_20775 [Paenibacillus polymyxa]
MQQKGANILYSDPYVPEYKVIQSFSLKSTEINEVKSLSILAYQCLIRKPHGDLFAQEMKTTYKELINDFKIRKMTKS